MKNKHLPVYRLPTYKLSKILNQIEEDFRETREKTQKVIDAQPDSISFEEAKEQIDKIHNR